MTTWNFGEEREIAPGNYARLITLHHGWAVWSFETATGKYFAVNKPADGKRHAAPLGVQQAFFGETPYASVIIHSPTPYVHFHGRHASATAKFRAVGERFLQSASHETSPSELDGKMLEVVVDSIPSDETRSGAVQEIGIFDMSGLASVIVFAEDLISRGKGAAGQ